MWRKIVNLIQQQCYEAFGIRHAMHAQVGIRMGGGEEKRP